MLVSRWSIALFAVALVSSSVSSSAAQSSEPSVHHVTPPPPPNTLAPGVSLDIRGAAIAPLYRDGLCPGDHACVLNGGVGVTVGLDLRWPDGWALLGRYDVWVVDAATLYGIGILNATRIGARYVILQAMNVHPYVEALAAFLGFGNSAAVVAPGGAITVGAGAEIELTDVLVIDLGVELWTFATGYFLTRDNVRRSDGFSPNLALQISIGLEVLLGSP